MLSFDIILPTILRPSLKETIDSVLYQNYRDWHLWIILDGVDLNYFTIPVHDQITTLEISRIRQGYNGAKARNLGIQQGSNPFIAYIDDDDIWLPHHLTTIAQYSTVNQEANMFRTAGQEMRHKHKHPRSSKKRIRLGQINSDDPLTVGISHSREIFDQTPGWQECDNHDHILWKDMIDAGGVPIVGDDVTFYFHR
jgi:hypothetical protein